MMEVMNPRVGVIMGSKSDLTVLQEAANALEEIGIPFELKVVSAHRTPEAMFEYARTARERGLEVIIAGAGGAAHLPGMVASLTTLPVIGVPVPTKALGGEDSLYSIVQMPAGVPVATVGIGNGRNAGLLAARILGVNDDKVAAALDQFRLGQSELVRQMNAEIAKGS
ncbi:MAG: N5-carboxyaminoimidazole ribonucleotide mutase [Chthonomonadaceae bacterium]|uniref:N5-carboxyaminoimidazole ribonucleotide mutase n=1 Tax=Candidatus Nitrosymbiomonas proteolyticus TaxID=2608984 RepID=A0A809RC03_9BACT|nr:N5-carboxyaminoimidazole ribonucleotide mutase [Candidatus Nitrosymbiomonas proteolyticus]